MQGDCLALNVAVLVVNAKSVKETNTNNTYISQSEDFIMPAYSGVTQYWTSSDGNTNAGTSYSNGDLPGDGNRLIISGQYSNQDFTTQPTWSVDFNQIIIEDDYTGQIFSSGNEMINWTADEIIYKGSATTKFYYQCNSSYGWDTDLFVVNCNNLTDALVISGDGLDTSDVSRLRIVRGGVTIAATMPTLAELEVSFRTSPSTDARVVISSGSSNTITFMEVAAGVVDNSRSTGTVVQSGGRLTTKSDISTRFVQAGGNHYYNSTSTSPKFDIIGGTTDLTRSAGAKTITSVRKWPQGKFIYTKNLHSVTLEVMNGTET